jgi:hypothetical protein
MSTISPGEAYRLGYLAGVDVGFADGYRQAWDDALAQTVAAFDPEYVPRTPYTGCQPMPGEPPPQRTTHTTDRRPQTPEQMIAAARWSWRRLARRQTGERTPPS